MSALLQNLAVGAIVLGAVAFLVVRRLRARRRPTPFCENCPGWKDEQAAPADPPLVSIGEPGRRTR